MKKTIIVLFLFLVGLNFVSADESGLVEIGGSKSTTLTLSLEEDKYLVGFSETENNFIKQDNIALSESINETAMTVSLVEKGFYFFYKAITDDPNVSFKIAVTPLYLGGTVVQDDSRKIDYTATITQTTVWNGDEKDSFTLNTSGTKESDACKLKKTNSYTNYFAKGVASVVIRSTEDLGSKVPGTYRGTITVTLQSE